MTQDTAKDIKELIVIAHAEAPLSKKKLQAVEILEAKVTMSKGCKSQPFTSCNSTKRTKEFEALLTYKLTNLSLKSNPNSSLSKKQC